MVEEVVVVLMEYPGTWVGLAVVCPPVGGMVARYIFMPWTPVDHWYYVVLRSSTSSRTVCTSVRSGVPCTLVQ